MPFRPFATPVSGLLVQRVLQATALVLFTGYGVVVTSAITQHLWPVTPRGGPGHIDFAEFWSAGRAVVGGHAASAYDWTALRRILDEGKPGGFGTTAFPFYYPPPVLLALAPFGLLPFIVAAPLWMAVGFIAYAAAVFAAARQGAVRLLVLASPAAFICLAVGQNGLLTAGLAGGALVLHRRLPLLAGVLIGLLAMKPQLAVLVPVAMLASGRWRVLASAAVTVIVLALAASAAFGPSIWGVCLHALHPAGGQPAPMTGLPPAKLQSLYGLARVLGLGAGEATAAQVIGALTALAFCVWLWRGERPVAMRAAGLCFAALLVSPYNCVYDLAITGVGLAFLMGGAGVGRLGAVQAFATVISFFLPLAFFVRPFPYGPLICVTLCAVTAVEVVRSTRIAADGVCALRPTRRLSISGPWPTPPASSTLPT